MGNVEFEQDLSPTDMLRARFVTIGNDVQSFSIQYQALIDGEWREFTRYDAHHGAPHQDAHDRAGRQQKSWWLANMPYSKALDYAINDIRDNWPRYKRAYLRSPQ